MGLAKLRIEFLNRFCYAEHRKVGVWMNPVIIACQTIENELLAAMNAEGVNYPIRWIESGLHNVPKLLNRRLQEELDACTGYDTVLLAMSFCGNCLIGLKTHGFRLVIPRSDDCITLLLGSIERRQENQYTYFLTKGWLNGERNIWVEYENCLKRYGEKRGKRIFDSLFANYKYIALVDTGAYDARSAEAEAKRIAEKLGLDFRKMEGSLDHLRLLLQEGWNEERFVLIAPNTQVKHSDCSLKGVEV